MWKEGTVVYFKILSQHLPAGTEKIPYRNPARIPGLHFETQRHRKSSNVNFDISG
jgi:hypothetical protein